MNSALNNVYCANTHPPSAVLGAAHGSYVIGGIVVPIVGTALVSNGVLWSSIYFLAIGLRLCCIVSTAYAFWNYDEHADPAVSAATPNAPAAAADKRKDLKVALENKVTIFGALFIFAYQGAEVSISGWIISDLINYRDGNPAKVGYVTAGFWVCAFAVGCSICVMANAISGWYHSRPLCPYSLSSYAR
jgi:fucose permease